MSERTLLPVVVAAKDGMRFPDRLRAGLREVLQALSVNPAAIESELTAMTGFVWGRSASRQVLGTMNDFHRMFESYRVRGSSLLDVALNLAEAPCGPIKMESPNRLTVEVLGKAAASGARGKGEIRRQTLRLVPDHRELFLKLSK